MGSIKIPIQVFRNRNFAIMESLVKYMKEDLDMTYAEIASELNRDDRTIWTVYSRARKKMETLKKKNNTYIVSKQQKNKNTYNVSNKKRK